MLKNQIFHIISKKSIMDFLEKRGHTPVQSMGSGRYKFLCPFKDHVESRPSFVVYTNPPYENFYCFGCSKNWNIIHLVSFLDGISYKEAVEKLSDGTVISTDEDVTIALNRIKIEQPSTNDFPRLLSQISWQCLLFSQGVKFDAEEIKIIDEYYKVLDNCILEADFDVVEESAEKILSGLMSRKKEYEKKCIIRARSAVQQG